MLKKRIIPCLDIKDGRTVKGVNFLALKDAGDPVELAKRYVKDGADELVFLDIAATNEDRSIWTALIEKIAKEINIPFTVGGGIKSLHDAQKVIHAGADKISLNSAAIRNPMLITEIAKHFGNQCVVVAIDIKYEHNDWFIYMNAGRQATGLSALQWAAQAVQLGAGEILITSMNNDGVKNGFALPILDILSSALSVPIIASGGAGSKEHFKELFTQTKVSATLAASVFHFSEIAIPDLKNYLKMQHIPIR